MAELIIENFEEKYYVQWDRFVDESSGGTLFHKSSFLQYHGRDFCNSLKIAALVNDNRITAGLLFKSGDSTDKKAISPAGASFGGILIKQGIGLEKSRQYTAQLLAALKEVYKEIECTLAPSCYDSNGEYIDWLLHANGFMLSKSDLFNVSELSAESGDFIDSLKSKVRNQVKTALAAFRVEEKSKDYKTFYKILLEDKARLDAVPTHTETDLKYLIEAHYPKAYIDFATHNVSGAKCGIFYLEAKPQIIMTFYISQEDSARGLNGINALIAAGAERSAREGFKYYDMGSSTFGYTVQNPGLASFKENFASKAFLRRTYKWKKEA